MNHQNQRYIDYAEYNIWANDRIIHSLLQLEKGMLNQEIVSSFPSINATIKHIWIAEKGWLSRLNQKGWDTAEVLQFSGSSSDLYKAWQSTSAKFKSFVETTDLEKAIPFEHKGQDFSIPTREIVQTVMNHGSYHRGQVVMMLRQLGITDILQTDYIEWVREIARKQLNS